MLMNLHSLFGTLAFLHSLLCPRCLNNRSPCSTPPGLETTSWTVSTHAACTINMPLFGQQTGTHHLCEHSNLDLAISA